MTPDQYHRMLLGLDSVLEVFKESRDSLTPEDLELKLQLTFMRAHVLRAESGHPFPSKSPSQLAREKQQDPDLTEPPYLTRAGTETPLPQKAPLQLARELADDPEITRVPWQHRTP